MSHMSSHVFLAVFLAVFCVSTPAWAYLDPGTGSVILQLLLGGVAGVLIVLKLYWQNFKSVFRRKEPKDGNRPPSE